MSSDYYHSRVIGYCYSWLYGLRQERKNGDRAERILVMDKECKESEPPPVSIEDRTILALLIED